VEDFTHVFQTRSGLKQGEGLASVLLNLALYRLIRLQ